MMRLGAVYTDSKSFSILLLNLKIVGLQKYYQSNAAAAKQEKILLADDEIGCQLKMSFFFLFQTNAGALEPWQEKHLTGR